MRARANAASDRGGRREAARHDAVDRQEQAGRQGQELRPAEPAPASAGATAPVCAGQARRAFATSPALAARPRRGFRWAHSSVGRAADS